MIFFQAEDGIRDFCLSRGLGDVYKRQGCPDLYTLENIVGGGTSFSTYDYHLFTRCHKMLSINSMDTVT